MAKSFKRTLIAAFGLLFLFATAFVAASCAEDATVKSYKVTLDYDDTHGSVTLSPEAENDTYASGKSVTVTVTPSGDYTVGTFKVNGEDKTLTNENTFTFDVVQDTTVAVTFDPPVTPTMYTVSKAAAENGTVTLDHEGEVAEGTVVTVTIAPATGYELDKAMVNTTDVTSRVADNKFTFTVEGDTTVAVTFKQTTSPTPALDISEKWVGTYTGNNLFADPEAVWVISITNASVALTIDGDAQTITDVEFAPDDDSFTFTLDGETVTVDAYGQEDGYGVYTLSVFTEESHSVYASLTDAKKVPLEPPLGDTITTFPQDFRGTWYGTDLANRVDYVFVISDTTMTITADDGSPTTINVADVLYNAHNGEDDPDNPTLYFTYNGTEESTLELAYSGDYLTFESDEIRVERLTKDAPVHYDDPTAFLAKIEGAWHNSSFLGDTNLVVSGGEVTKFELRGTDYTDSAHVHGLDENGRLVIEAGDALYYFTYSEEYKTLNITDDDFYDFDLEKTEIENTLPSDYVGKWVKIEDESYIEVAQDGTAKYYSYDGASGYDITISGVGGVYTLNCLVINGEAALKEEGRVLSVGNRNFAKDGVEISDEEKIPAALRGTTWSCSDPSFGISSFAFSTDGLTADTGATKFHVYFAHFDLGSGSYSFNLYSGSDMHSFVYYTRGSMVVDDEYSFREGSGDEGGLDDFAGTYKTLDGTHTIVIADGSMTYDGTPADSVDPYGDGMYGVMIGEDEYTLMLTDFGTVKICGWSGDDGTQSFFVPEGTVSGKINAALAGTWKGTADTWYDDNGPSEDAAFFGDMTLVVNADGTATLNGENAFVFVTYEEEGEYSYWFIGANEAFGSCTYLISYIPAEDPDAITLTLLDTYYLDLAKEEAGPTYADATAFLAQIEGSWSFPSIYFGDTFFVVSGGEVTKFEFNGTDYTDSVNVLGLDKDGKLAVKAGGVLYSFTYSADYDSLTVSSESGDEHDLNRTVAQNTLPDRYAGKWVAINGEAYIVVSDEGTAKYYANADAAGTDLTVVGFGSSYSFDDATFDDGTLALKEEGRVLSVGNLNFAKDGVEVSDEEKIPAVLRGTTWSCSDPSFGISSFAFSTDGLTADTGDAKFHVYFAHSDLGSDSYSFNLYSGSEMHSFVYYTRGSMFVDDEYSFREGSGDEGGLDDFAGTYREANGTRTLVISGDGSVTVDGTPADSVKPDGEGIYTVTAGDREYTLMTTDYEVVKICALSEDGTQAFFVPEGTVSGKINAALVGTWKGTADGWSDPMGTSSFGAITLVVNADGTATLNGKDTFVFFGVDLEDEDYSQYSYYFVGTSELFGSLVYAIDYIPGEDPNTVALTLLDTYYLDLAKEGSVVPGTAIDDSLYGVWRGDNGGDSYVVTIDAEGVHFKRGDKDPVDGTVHDIAADGLSFDVDVQFPNTMSPYNFHAVYSDADSTLTLTEGSVQIVLTKDSADMETIPALYQGSWVLADYNDSSKIVGSIVVTKNTITLTYNGRSYSTVTVTLDDVDALSKVTFIADGDEFSLSTDTYSGKGAFLGKPNPGGWNDLIATLEEEGYSGTFEIPESVRGDYHTEDNSITLKVTDTAVTGTIDGKEVTFNVTDLKNQMGTVTISLTDDDGGEGYLSFYEGDVESEIPAKYTFFWEAADAVAGGTMHDLVKDGAVDPTAHPLTGTWNTASSDSAFAGKDIVVDRDGGVTVGGDAATLTESGSSWKLTFGGKDYTITNDKTYGSDVLVINDPDGGVHFAFRDGVTHSVDLNVEALVGTWKNTDKGITVVVTPDGITFNGETAFAYAYYNGTQGYKILAGGVQYNFSTTGEGTADLFNNKVFETTHLTLVPEVEHALAGKYHTQEGDTSAFGSNVAVVVSATGQLTVNGVEATLTGDDTFTATVNGVQYTVTLGTSDCVLTFTSSDATIYAIRDGAVSPELPLKILLGYWQDDAKEHTVVVSADGITYDGMQGFVTGSVGTTLVQTQSITFLAGGVQYSFKTNDKGTSATIASTTFKQTEPPEDPDNLVTADWKGSYSWMLTTDKPWTAKANGDAGNYELTITLDDKDCIVITLSVGGAGKTVSAIKVNNEEITFRVDGGGEDWRLTASGSVAGNNCQLSLYDPTSWPYNHQLELKSDDEGGGAGGGGADGVYTFTTKLQASYVGVWTGTDAKGHNWTITTTETSVKVECDGVVQVLTDITSYGNMYGLDFKIDGKSYSFWNNGNQVLQIVAEGDWVTLTKA